MVCNDTETFLCSNVKGRKQWNTEQDSMAEAKCTVEVAVLETRERADYLISRVETTGFSHEKEIK